MTGDVGAARSAAAALAGLALLAGCRDPLPPAPAVPASIEIVAQPDSVLFEAERVDLGFTVRAADGREIADRIFEVRWSSEDTLVAMVEPGGALTGRTAGETRIRVELLGSIPPLEALVSVKVVREGGVLWRFVPPAGHTFPTLGGATESTDGEVVYVFSRDIYTTATGRLHAVDAATGAPRWEVELPGAYGPYPTVGPDGTIYSTGEWVHAVTPAGAVLWAFNLEIGPPGSFLAQTLSPGGDTLYVAGAYRFWAFDARTGEVFWSRDGEDGYSLFTVPPTLSDDGAVIYVPRSAVPFQARDARTGAVLWQVPNAEFGEGHHMHGAAPWGDVLLVSFRYYRQALRRSDGALLWQTDRGNGYTEPAIDPQRQRFYEQSNTHGLIARGLDGEMLWRTANHAGQAPVWAGGPLLTDDGTVFLAAWTGFWAVDTYADGALRWKYPAAQDELIWFHGAPLLVDGRVISFSADTLYAFRTRRARLAAESPWPMWRRNPQRTGAPQR
jgi:outer membrane protein assembly factor BamB